MGNAILGLQRAKEWHDSNTGLPYNPFNLKKDKDEAVVRVLGYAEPEYLDDEKTKEVPWADRPLIVSMYIHSVFKVLNRTRCAAPGEDKDAEACPLCRADVPRSIRTFIPVRRRGAEPPDRVEFIEYGRDNLQTVIAAVEEIENNDITCCDFKIKRAGSGTDTKYYWVEMKNSFRPLDSEEKALIVPDLRELIPIKDVDELEKAVVEYQRAKKAGDSSTKDEKAETREHVPF